MRGKLGSVGYLKAANAGYAIGLDEDGHRIESLGERQSIALATVGAVTADGGLGGAVELTPGVAVVITPDEGSVRISGAGEVFIAQPGVVSAS